MNLIDLDRCCKLAELADSDITLTHKELRNMLDTINGLRNQRDELRARLDAQGQTPKRKPPVLPPPDDDLIYVEGTA